MALPDLTGLTTDELIAVLQEGNRLLAEQRSTEQDVHETLLAPDVVRSQIENLTTQAAAVQSVIDTPNRDIKDNPQTHIVALARAQKRTINNLIRVLRTSAGVLDSTDVGE